MVQAIQWVGLLFAVAVIYVTYTNYRRREFTVNEFGFWSLLAISIGGIAMAPSVLDPFVDTFNFARTLDFVIVIGFLFLITASFYTYLVSRRTHRMVEEVVRRFALENQDRKRQKKK